MKQSFRSVRADTGAPLLAMLVLISTVSATTATRYLKQASQAHQNISAISKATKRSPPPPAMPSPTIPDDQYVAMCLIIRDHHNDVLEWVEHYFKLGVRRIYMYDHGSHPLLLPMIAHYEMAGLIDYHWFTSDMMNERKRPYQRHVTRSAVCHGCADQNAGLNFSAINSTATNSSIHPPPPPAHRFNAQMWVYKECLDLYSHLHRWITFFDSDEFLLFKDPTIKDLPTFLKGYEAYGGLVVNWMSFGSSGHLTRPNGTTLESYWRCSPGRTVKSICNTLYCTAPGGNPHTLKYRDGKYAVNEKFERVDSHQSETVSMDKVVLNHYVIKSKEEFLAKTMRGSGDGTTKSEGFFQAVDRSSLQNCTDAVELMEGRTFDIDDVL